MAIAYDNSAKAMGSTSASSFSQAYATAAIGADVFVAITSVTTTSFGEVSAVEYNGVTMTSLATLFVYEATFDYGALYLYRAAGAGTGSPANITGTFSGTGIVSIEAASYTGVSSVGAAVTTTGTSTSPATGSVTCTSGQWALAVIGTASSAFTPTISAPTGGTNRQLATGSPADTAMALSDSSSTATFSATLSTSSPWATIAVVLKPPLSAALAGHGTLAVTTKQICTSAPALHGAGALTARTHIVGFGGAGALTAAAHVSKYFLPAALSGHGAMGGHAYPAASLHGRGALAGTVYSPPFSAVLYKLANNISASILALGDSTTFGAEDTLNIGGWPARIGMILGAYYNVNVIENAAGTPTTSWTSTNGGSAATLTVYNNGVVGTSLEDDELNIGNLITISNPDVIFIGDGFNDMDEGTSASSFASEYQGFITSYVQPRCPNVPIIITTENQTPYVTTIEGQTVDQAVYYAAFSAMANAFTGQTLPLSPPIAHSSSYPTVSVIDTQQAFNGMPLSGLLYGPSPLHPVASGYQVEANFILEQIAPNVTNTLWPLTVVTANLTGNGTLSGHALTFNRSPMLAGHGALTATARVKVPAAAGLPGHGALTAAAFGVTGHTATLPGHGVLSASVYAKRPAAAPSSGHGALSATALAPQPAAATLTGHGAISVSAHLYSLHATAALSGSGTLERNTRVPAGSPLTGAGELGGHAEIIYFYPVINIVVYSDT